MARRKNSRGKEGVRPNYTPGKPGEVGEKRAKFSGEKSPTESKDDGKTPPDSKDVVPPINDRGTRPVVNDPEWYAQDPNLLNDSAKLNYSDPFGQPLVMDTVNLDIFPSGDENHRRIMPDVAFKAKAIQGVCSLVMKHSIGTSMDRNDPANVAASAFYSFVRYVNSGRKNYDPADLMIYALMVGDLYAYIAYLKRLYGYAFLYSQTNQYIGKSLLETNGVDSDDMLANLANFRYFVNAFVNKVASFVIPSNVPYFSRRRFMYDGLYIENPYANLKDQLYQFVPEGFYSFFTDGVGKGALKWTPLTTVNGDFRTKGAGNLLKVSDLVNYANSLLSNIMGDEDFGLMSGDILKAYGTNIVSLESLPEEYYVLPHYDMTVLSQFKNATVCGFAARTGVSESNTYESPNDGSGLHATYYYGNVYQDSKGNILCREGTPVSDNIDITAALYMSHLNKVLSVELPNPGPADNIEATRMTIVADRIRSTYNNGMLDFQCGVDFPVIMILRSNENYRASESSPVYVRSLDYVLRFNGVTGTNMSINMATCIAQFKYIPTLYCIILNDMWLKEAYTLSNVDNYTIVNRDVLAKMHTCALLSLFYVPGVAKLINVM